MLTVDKPVGPALIPTQYVNPETLRFPIPHGIGGDVIVALMLRVHGLMTIAVDACTGLQARGMERVIRSLRLFADDEKLQIEGALRSYTVQGVNDAVGGRTLSFAGVALALESLLDTGTPIESTDPGLTVAAQPVDIVFPLRFIRPRAKNPWTTALDTRRLRNLYLEVQQGILDTAAAGDDTDVLVTDATSTVACALEYELQAVVLKRAPAGMVFDIRKVRSLTANLVEGNEVPRDLGRNAVYQRLSMLCTDDDVLSNARVADVSVRVDDSEDMARGSWGVLRGAAKSDYGLAALPDGMNVITFPSGLDARRTNACALSLNVPAGAAIADDRLMVLSEELITRPKMNSGVVGGGRSARRG